MSHSPLLIIDAMALAYRSFHAIKPMLTTKDGIPTNAVLGFIRALDSLRAQWNPGFLAVVFDGGSPAHRLELVPEYKAQRKPLPPELKRQMQIIAEYLDVARIRRLRQEKQEADDLMASLAVACADEQEVLIATADKDLFQVVTERIALLPSFDQVRMGPAEVEAKTGITPGQVVDWLALIGDAADNFAGIPGVGKKTAALWLQRYGSIENMLANVEALEPARFRDVLRGSVPLIERNRNMVRLNVRMDCGITRDELKVSVPPWRPLIDFYERYEMHSLAKKASQGELF